MPLWLWLYRSPHEHPAVDSDARESLRRDAAEAGGTPASSWWRLLQQRRVWGLVLPRLASDPVWYFYLFWLPDYLQRQRGLTLAELGIYGWVPFLAADIGNIVGGASSDWLINRGWTPVRARTAALIGVACLAPLGALSGIVSSTVAASFRHRFDGNGWRDWRNHFQHRTRSGHQPGRISVGVRPRGPAAPSRHLFADCDLPSL
jgi:ACS family hexuronate transporter-like MFS transporter